MKPEITISLELYDVLCEDSEAFRRHKKGQPYVHFYSSYAMGGRYTEVTSNDERFIAIKEEVDRLHNSLYEARNSQREAEQALREIEKRGWVKRLFA